MYLWYWPVDRWCELTAVVSRIAVQASENGTRLLLERQVDKINNMTKSFVSVAACTTSYQNTNNLVADEPKTVVIDNNWSKKKGYVNHFMRDGIRISRVKKKKWNDSGFVQQTFSEILKKVSVYRKFELEVCKIFVEENVCNRESLYNLPFVTQEKLKVLWIIIWKIPYL